MNNEVKNKFRDLYDLIDSQAFDVAKNAELKTTISDNATLKTKVSAYEKRINELEQTQETDCYIEMGPGKRDDVLHYIDPSNLVNQQVMEALERLFKRIGPLPLLTDLEKLIKKYNA